MCIQLFVSHPDRTTPIGKIIDAYLRSQSDLDQAIHLLFSPNRWELAYVRRPVLLYTNAAHLSNKLSLALLLPPIQLLVPRLLSSSPTAMPSGTAFSHAKGLPHTWCRASDISLPAPDLTLFLDISPEMARERGGYGRERYEKEEMQKKVREVFLMMASEMGGTTSFMGVRARGR